MATEPFWGTWRVSEVTPSSSSTPNPELSLLEEAEFTLKENGDVEWRLASGRHESCHEKLPLLECDTFEVLRERDGFTVVVLLRFGAWKGCIVEFFVDSEHGVTHTWAFPRSMVLTLEGWCSLTCHSIRKLSDEKFDTTFHFLPALEFGMFNDFTIESRSGREYQVHKTVLQAEKINTADDKLLKSCFYGFSDEVTRTFLHFVYARCLPPHLSPSTAQQVIEFSRNQPNFHNLGKLCEDFIRMTNFQCELVQLVRDMQQTFNNTLLLYGGKTLDEHGKEKTPRNRQVGRSLVANPAKLCSVIKQTFTNCLLVGLKVIQFCDKFVKFKNSLSKKDQIALFIYAKSQLPVFIAQVRELCKSLKYAAVDMDNTARHDIAAYFVTEIEELMAAITNFGLVIQDVHQKVIEATCQTREFNLKHAKNKNRPLKHILITKEILYMKSFDDRLGHILGYLIQEREGFEEQPLPEKIRDISRQIEQLVDEIPFTIHKLAAFSNLLHEKLDLESFKFCFTVAASLISELLEKYKVQRRHLRHFLGQVTAQLQNEAVEEVLQQLGLMEPTTKQAPRPAPSPTKVSSSSSSPLDLTTEFSTPLNSIDNNLAAFSYNLLQTLEGADMEFEVLGEVGGSLMSQSSEQSTTKTVMKAHRVIVCSRCPWFRRALTSGMRESIERRITLHDCSVPVFRLFLQFLYSGLYRLDLGQETAQQLADLLLLADRYEVDDLKSCCEDALIAKVDNDSCFALLVLSDQFQAGRLRRACFEWIAQRPGLSTEENLEELPENLQEELRSLGSWIRDGVLAGEGNEPKKEDTGIRFPFKPGASLDVDDLRELEDLTANLRLGRAEMEEEELETIPLTTDSSSLDACVVALREVLGPLVPEESLIQIALSADCNIDRALNHFFNTN